jgi:hypothetical protein
MATAVRQSKTDGIAQCGMSRATPEKPLDAGIGQLLAPYCPISRQGNRQTNNNQQIHLKSWQFWWPRQCAGTIPLASPNRGGPGLQEKLMDATKGQALAPKNINRTYLRRFL